MRSLLTCAQRALTDSSPTWWPMAEARGEKIVRSIPRSAIRRSWLVSIVSRISSSEILGYGGGAWPASKAAHWASRQAVCAAGAVV